MAALDLHDLKHYVAQSSGGLNPGASTVIVRVTHQNLAARIPEIRLDLHNTILTVKEKLYTHFGTAVGDMKLQLKEEDGTPIGYLDDDTKKLGFYSVQSGNIIHVIDLNLKSITTKGQLEDVSQVEKYVMSDEDYSKRDNTYRKYKEEKMKKDPTWSLAKEQAKRRGEEIPDEKSDDYLAELTDGIQVGDRCEVHPGGRRGVVRYVGKVPELHPGFWVGVQYDEPMGKSNGSVKGVQYFECPDKYGGFLRPNCVTVGDFPEEDPFAIDDGEI